MKPTTNQKKSKTSRILLAILAIASLNGAMSDRIMAEPGLTLMQTKTDVQLLTEDGELITKVPAGSYLRKIAIHKERIEVQLSDKIRGYISQSAEVDELAAMSPTATQLCSLALRGADIRPPTGRIKNTKLLCLNCLHDLHECEVELSECTDNCQATYTARQSRRSCIKGCNTCEEITSECLRRCRQRLKRENQGSTIPP